MSSLASTITSAAAKPAAGSPTRAVESPATLSGQPSNTFGASAASARSRVPAAGSGSYSARIAAAASAAT
jgi:hypothetical protein